MSDYISRNVILKTIENSVSEYGNEYTTEQLNMWSLFTQMVKELPSAINVVEFPQSGIGDLSDGYHTFNGLYHQRAILFAALVKAHKDRAWKSWRHEDGEECFGGGWFITGIDTPKGTYTYHYEEKYWDMFDCDELVVAKHWDGHTEDDAKERLLSLPDPLEDAFESTMFLINDLKVEIDFLKKEVDRIRKDVQYGKR